MITHAIHRRDLSIALLAGSRTKGAVCIEHGRCFHGTNLREKYAALARARKNKAAAKGMEASNGGD